MKAKCSKCLFVVSFWFRGIDSLERNAHVQTTLKADFIDYLPWGMQQGGGGVVIFDL